MAEYLALPKGEGRHPAVVVVQEWWGVNDQIKGICDKWAAEGFVALAPDLYHGQVVPFGDAAKAQELMTKLDRPKALQELASAVHLLKTHPRGNGKVVVTGYCMGGAMTLATAASVKGIAAAIPFYGLPPGADWSQVEAPVQMHVAEHDDWVTVDAAKKVQQAIGKNMELHTYDAHHAFCNERRPEVYNAAACAQAWQRALAFAKQHVA
ncbi:MAG: dienelactone hydrolase family protein [Acidobacteriota bacterium]